LLHESSHETEGFVSSPAVSAPVDAQPNRTMEPVSLGEPDGDELTRLTSQEAAPMEAGEPVLLARASRGRVRVRTGRWRDRLKRGERWKRRLPEVCR
jgi:hypothetical protein